MKRFLKKFLCLGVCATLLVSQNVSFANENNYNKINVPYISQLYPVNAPVGCEAIALLMGLRYKGVATNVSIKEFLDKMPKSKSNPAYGYVGSPYVPSEKLRTTIYPEPITKYANTYGNNVAKDISGADLEEVKKELLNDNPVMIYATLYYQKPYYRNFNIDGKIQRLLRNNHAILLAGYDSKNKKFYVADPYNKKNRKAPYFYWIDESKLKPIYDERKWAVVVTGENPVPKDSYAIFKNDEFKFLTKWKFVNSYKEWILVDIDEASRLTGKNFVIEENLTDNIEISSNQNTDEDKMTDIADTSVSETDEKIVDENNTNDEKPIYIKENSNKVIYDGEEIQFVHKSTKINDKYYISLIDLVQRFDVKIEL